ncbi:MAG: hypothetical protein ACD_45C00495G0001, partial [uncultured bacterium]
MQTREVFKGEVIFKNISTACGIIIREKFQTTGEEIYTILPIATRINSSGNTSPTHTFGFFPAGKQANTVTAKIDGEEYTGECIVVAQKSITVD